MLLTIPKPYLCRRLKLQTVGANPLSLRQRYLSNPIYQYALSNLNDFPDQDMVFSIIAQHRKNACFLGYAKGFHRQQNHSIWLQVFFVDQAYMRRGYGTEFYEELCTLLLDHFSFNKVYLSCHQENEAGCAFWKKLGFTQIAETVKQDAVAGQPHIIHIFENSFVKS